jgi:hypothetical protein
MPSTWQLIEMAEESVRLGRRAARKGAYILAMARYSEALGMLKVIWAYAPLSRRAEEALTALMGAVEAGYQALVMASGNGKRNPKSKNTVSAASKVMLADLRELE